MIEVGAATLRVTEAGYKHDFDRGLNQEFHGSWIELEGITMDFKKFIADLAAMYRKPTEPTPARTVVDVDAVDEVGWLSPRIDRT